MPQATYLSYKDTHYFSPLVLDYLEGSENLRDLYMHRPDLSGIAQAIEARRAFPTDRKLLVDVLKEQYQSLPVEEAVMHNIEALLSENTFTICTAHQPNLGTGYLYFIYKILHAVKLADELKQSHPDKHFVPVYYIGSEDNDLDELGTFRYGGKKFIWDAGGQTGAVGRMKTDSLKPLLDELFALLGPPGNSLIHLKELLTTAYLKHDNIADATQYLVHSLTGKYGLVALNPDDARLKQNFVKIMKDDLLNHTALSLVTATADVLEKNGYKAQAFPRPINLFYLKDDIRERIERKGDEWQVVNADIHWKETELLKELEDHPDHFSPNVILRGLYQETILPDIAFIGGGAEVAYWLQLRGVFEHYSVPYPLVLLRQSALWIDPQDAARRREMGLSIADLFIPEATLTRDFVKKHSSQDMGTEAESRTFQNLLSALKEKATSIDPTLKRSAEAVLTKIKYQLEVLEKKMLRAGKRKMHHELEGIAHLKNQLFPNGGLQERVENFMSFYLQHGDRFFDELLKGIRPLGSDFLVLEEADSNTP